MTPDVTQIISYRPANTDALWQEVIDGYMTLNSEAVRQFAQDRLNKRDLNNFERGLDYYNMFTAGLAVSIRKKVPRPTPEQTRRYVRNNGNVLALIQRKLQVLSNLIVKRTLTLSIKDLLHTFATQRGFSKAQRNFAKANSYFAMCKWNLLPDDGAVNIDTMSDSALDQLFARLNAISIKELVLPQITSGNAKRVLNILSNHPLKAYHRSILPRVINLFLSGAVTVPSNNVGIANPQHYWSGVPRSKIGNLLSAMDNKALAKIVPFLNLTIREIESLDLYFDQRSIRYMGMSKFPAVRAYWIASRVSNVLPALFIYNRRGYTMSPAERNLLGIYGGQLALAESSLSNTRLPKEWRWFHWPNIPADLIADWQRFEQQARPYAYNLDLKPLGAYLKEGSGVAIMVYRTIYGHLSSKRAEDACLSMYIYCQGKRSGDNPNPTKDAPLSLAKWQLGVTDAITLAANLELAQQKS